MQIGGLFGYRIWRLTPYIGVSYSHFDRLLSDTAAFNYGIYFDVPVIPISIGLDCSYQQPKFENTKTSHHRNQIALTIGLIF